MQFSVLMSVYYKEKAEYLNLSLESIINQTLKPTEIVLVQDGKLTKELYTVIENYKQKYPDILKTYALKENQGLGKALNYGLQKCSNELIARMDTDDIAEPNRFEMQIQEFRNDNKLALCGGQIAEFADNPKEITSYRQVPIKQEEILKFAKKRNPFNHVTVMFKKQVVQNVGGYQHMPYFEDYWLWARMLEAGCKAKNVNAVLVKVRAGQGMIARRGGFEYIKDILRFENNMLKINYINILAYLKIIILRILISLISPDLRKVFYNKFLRNNKERFER